MRIRRVKRAGVAGLGLLGLVTAAEAASAHRDVVVTHYPPGASDDLLTAGLGAAGLQAAFPGAIDPTDPAQLRRLAIYNNYRALVDTSGGGGYGTLYGPTVDAPAEAGPDGQIYGWEYLTLDRRHGADVTIMVQIPAFFGQSGRPACIVTGPSSGSRGVYGAIGTSGEWGLKKGCAVAYTDKGTGIGAHDLQAGTVTTLQGVREPVATAGRDSNFTARVPGPQLERFLAEHPNRWAWKHAHSRANPEGDWDEFVLHSIEFAFAALNEQLGGTGKAAFSPANTLVIASSVSNGGAASLRAAEKAKGLIDAVVVSEPNVNPRYDPRFGIQQGDGPVLRRPQPATLRLSDDGDALPGLRQSREPDGTLLPGSRACRRPGRALPVVARGRAAGRARPRGLAAGGARPDQRLWPAAGAERGGSVLLGLLCRPGGCGDLRQRLQPGIGHRGAVRLFLRRELAGGT